MKLSIEKAENGFILILQDDKKAIYNNISDLMKRTESELKKSLDDEIELEEMNDEISEKD